MDGLFELLQSIEITLGTNVVHLNLLFMAGIIIFIQILKKILSKKLTIDPDIWKAVVFFSGFVMSAIQFGIDNLYTSFDIWLFIMLGLIYAGVSSVVYQTGKLGMISISGEKNEKDIN